MLRFEHTARQLINQTIEEGGTTTFTFNVVPEDLEGQVYVVGDGKHEVKFFLNYNSHELANALALYLQCFLFDDDADTIGTWLDDGNEIYFDTGKLFYDLEEAICFAKEHNELAIYDYTNKEVINV